jgi:glutamate carboxypeptidase
MTIHTTLKTIVEGSIPDTLTLLEEIVNINSYSSNIEGNNLVQDVLQREFLDLGLRIERIPCTECGDILIARNKTSGSDDLLLSGHTDTVFPPISPFQKMTYDGERVLGPGVCDMKGGLVTIILALKALKKIDMLDAYPLRVLINTDEETGSVYSRKTFGEQAQYIKKAFVFETGRVNDLIVTSRVGSRSFLLKVQGKAAHSGSAFLKGANAITRIAYIINELRTLTDFENGLTCNIGTIRGGEAVNVVPEYAESRFELRAEKKEILEEATERAVEIIHRELIPQTTVTLETVYTSFPFERTPEVISLFNEYQKAGIQAGLQYETNDAPIRGGSDANFFAGKGIPTLDALGPFGEGHHSTNEFMSIPSIAPKALNWLYWLLEENK